MNSCETFDISLCALYHVPSLALSHGELRVCMTVLPVVRCCATNTNCKILVKFKCVTVFSVQQSLCLYVALPVSPFLRPIVYLSICLSDCPYNTTNRHKYLITMTFNTDQLQVFHFYRKNSSQTPHAPLQFSGSIKVQTDKHTELWL